MRCSDGHVRWGVFGAAGVVFVLRPAGMAPLVMLQKRSAWAHEGGTWSCAGGAIDEGETPYEAALREAGEEVGEIPATHRLLGEYVFAPCQRVIQHVVVPDRVGSPILGEGVLAVLGHLEVAAQQIHR